MEQYECYTADYAPYFTADINGWKPIIQTLSPRHYKRGSIICHHYGEDQNVVLIQTGLVSMSFLHESGIERIHFLGSTGYVFGFPELSFRASLWRSTHCHHRCFYIQNSIGGCIP